MCYWFSRFMVFCVVFGCLACACAGAGAHLEKKTGLRVESVRFRRSAVCGSGHTNSKTNNYSMREGDYSIEHKLLLVWERSSTFRAMIGYKLVSGQYPYGKQTRLLPYIPLLEQWLPLVELQWLR